MHVTSDKRDIQDVLAAAPVRGRWRRRLVPAALAAAAAFGAWAWFAPAVQDAAGIYDAVPATRGALLVTVIATGTVEPTNLVEISSELSGTLRAVNVDHNDQVTVGQELAQLDTDKLEAALAHSRAALEARRARIAEAEATVNEAQQQFARIAVLAERAVVSEQSLQAAQAALSRAEATVAVTRADAKVAEADLRSDETNLAKACICSPIAGVVLERNADVGQIVASALQAPVLFTIAEDLRQMELRVDVDEADMGVVTVGAEASFSVEAHQGRLYPARIAELRYAPQTIDGVVTYQAILSIDNSDLSLRPGMTATAEIVVERIADALLIPNAALRFAPPIAAEEGAKGGGLLGLLLPRRPSDQQAVPRDGGAGTRTVWVLKDATAVPISVETGATDGTMTAIISGALAAGDKVITDMDEAR